MTYAGENVSGLKHHRGDWRQPQTHGIRDGG